MRYLPEFLGAISAMIMALLAFTLPPGKPRGAIVKYSLLLIAVVICLGALLYRGFTGKGIDDTVATILVDQTCRFIDLTQCAERDNDIRKVQEEAKRASRLAAAKREQDRKAAEDARQRELDLVRLKTEVDAARRAQLDAERLQLAAQKLAAEKAEETQRVKDAEAARERARTSLPQMQNGKLTSVSGLRIQLIHGNTPDDLQASRGVRRLIARLNGTVVPRGETASVDWTIRLRVNRTEKIGARLAEVTLSLDCTQPRATTSCFVAPVSVNGNGAGPHFDSAIEHAIDDAISQLERSLPRILTSKP
jgi:hypothetical protein